MTDHSREATIARIQNIFHSMLVTFSRGEMPTLSNGNVVIRFTPQQARSYTSILLVLSYVHKLLLSNQTATLRDEYYFHQDHFSNQVESDAAILNAVNLLGVSRSSLGIFASPKGWYCGCIEIIRDGSIVDGTTQSSNHGLPITGEWEDASNRRDDEQVFTIRSNARFILVIEKEGVYLRFSQVRFFDRIPFILVTGQGNSGVSTRGDITACAHVKSVESGISDVSGLNSSVTSKIIGQLALMIANANDAATLGM
jgi:DNA topoisomerase VI subunit A